MMWNLVFVAIAVWIAFTLLSKVHKWIKGSTFPYRKHWALTLAQPMVEAQGLSGFSSPDSEELAQESQATLRAGLLHYLELSPKSSDEEAVRRVAECYEAQWFQIDLRGMQATDDPEAAIAFACVRVAFFTRILMLMKWIDMDAGWRVLLLNGQRAQECFSSWQDFGQKYRAGRRQWTSLFRADPLGAAFEEEELRRLTTGLKPWAIMPWVSTAIFDPTAASRRPNTARPKGLS